MDMKACKTSGAFEYLRERIIDGRLPPLSLLDEKQLQLEIGMSRTPIREAMLRLQDLGLVSIVPKKMTVVTPISLELIDELYAARFQNEAEINYEASLHIDPALLQDFRDQFEHFAAMGQDLSVRPDLVRLDDRLHDALLEHSQNRFLKKAFAMVYLHSMRLRRFIRSQISAADHIMLIDALLSRDRDQIRAASLAHLGGSKDMTIRSYLQGELSALKKGN